MQSLPAQTIAEPLGIYLDLECDRFSRQPDPEWQPGVSVGNMRNAGIMRSEFVTACTALGMKEIQGTTIYHGRRFDPALTPKVFEALASIGKAIEPRIAQETLTRIAQATLAK